MPCYRWDGGLPRSAAHGAGMAVRVASSLYHGAFSRDWQKETRRAGSTAGGYLIKWTPSRGAANTPPMYSSGKDKAANVTA